MTLTELLKLGLTLLYSTETYYFMEYDTIQGYAVNIAERTGCEYHSQYKYPIPTTANDSGFKYKIRYKCKKEFD